MNLYEAIGEGCPITLTKAEKKYFRKMAEKESRYHVEESIRTLIRRRQRAVGKAAAFGAIYGNRADQCLVLEASHRRLLSRWPFSNVFRSGITTAANLLRSVVTPGQAKPPA